MRKIGKIGLVVLCSCFLACQDILEVDDISSSLIFLVAPTDNSTVQEGNVNFTWTEITEATGYHIQIAYPDFDNASQIVLDSIVVIDSTYIGPNLTKELLSNNYQWRVKGFNSDYQTDFTVSSFTVNSQ